MKTVSSGPTAAAKSSNAAITASLVAPSPWISVSSKETSQAGSEMLSLSMFRTMCPSVSTLVLMAPASPGYPLQKTRNARIAGWEKPVELARKAKRTAMTSRKATAGSFGFMGLRRICFPTSRP